MPDPEPLPQSAFPGKQVGGHPRGLYTLFFTEMWERFSYYGMRALLVLFMVDAVEKGGLNLSDPTATAIYGLYTALVYMAALPGGWIADRLLGAQRSVWYGGMVIAAGHFALAVPSLEFFFLGLILVIAGTGLLKPNISAIVGQLYPEGGARRDAGFTIFYMGINVGAAIGPLICSTLGEKVNWHYGFGAAGVGMLAGLIQFRLTRKHLGEAGLYPSKQRASGQRMDRAWYGVGVATLVLIVLVIFGLVHLQSGKASGFTVDDLNRPILGAATPQEGEGGAASPSLLLQKLQDDPDEETRELSNYLWSLIPPETKEQLTDPELPSGEKDAVLAAAIERILTEERLNPTVVDESVLSPATRHMLERLSESPADEAQAAANRAILEDAYPTEISRRLAFDPVPVATNATYVIVGLGVVYFIGIFLFGHLERIEMKRLSVLVVLLIASAMFWAGFEQAGSSLNLFAERYTDRIIEWFNFEIPAGWFQSLNPVFIIIFSPVMASFWVMLARRNLDPSIPAKFAWGLVLLGLGFLVMAAAATLALSSGQTMPTWLILTYLLHTLGELCLSPVGLSAVTKLAPGRFVGQMMGLWFLASSLGNLIAGLIAGEVTEAREMPGTFLQIVLTTVGTGAVLLVLSRPLKRLMGGIR